MSGKSVKKEISINIWPFTNKIVRSIFNMLFFCEPNPLWLSQYNPHWTSKPNQCSLCKHIPLRLSQDNPRFATLIYRPHFSFFVEYGSRSSCIAPSSERNRDIHRDSWPANCCVCKKPEPLKCYEISLMANRSLRIKGYSTQVRLPPPEGTVL